MAAHVPYLAWLLQNSTNSTAAAREAETVAAAYTAALSAMPTLEQLATNHAVFAQLVATNFFGVNTIPIAQNEIEYLQMWLQAATTMAIYEAVSETAMTWKPPTAPPPQIQKTGVANQDAGGGPTQLSWWVTRVQEVARAISGDLSQSPSNPSATLSDLMSDPLLATEVPHWAGESLLYFTPQVPQLTQLSFGLIAPFIPAAGAPGVAGLAGLAGLAGAPRARPARGGGRALRRWSRCRAGPRPGRLRRDRVAGPGARGHAGHRAGPGRTTHAAAGHRRSRLQRPVRGRAARPRGRRKPVGRGPRRTDVTRFRDGGGAGRGGPARTGPLPAAPAAGSDRPRIPPRIPRHRFRRGYESVTASDRGAGPIGFAGTTGATGSAPVGLTTVAGDALDDGPRMPLLPGSWSAETDDPETGRSGAAERAAGRAAGLAGLSSGYQASSST